MKLTKAQLKHLIREELNTVLQEAPVDPMPESGLSPGSVQESQRKSLEQIVREAVERLLP